MRRNRVSVLENELVCEKEESKRQKFERQRLEQEGSMQRQTHAEQMRVIEERYRQAATSHVATANQV